jgi:hypothetical protein
MDSSTTDLRRLRLFRALAEEPSKVSAGQYPRPKLKRIADLSDLDLVRVLRLRRGRTS